MPTSYEIKTLTRLGRETVRFLLQNCIIMIRLNKKVLDVQSLKVLLMRESRSLEAGLKRFFGYLK